MPGRYESFDLALSRAALLRFGRQGGFSYHIVYARHLSHLASTHWVVYFYKLYYNILDFWLCWLLSHFRYGQTLEGSAPFLRFLWFLNVSDGFLEWVLKLSEILSNSSHTSWLVCTVWFPWVSPLLLPVFLLSERLSGGVLFGGYFLSLSYLWWQGLRNFRRDWFAPSQGILSLPYFPLVS